MKVEGEVCTYLIWGWWRARRWDEGKGEWGGGWSSNSGFCNHGGRKEKVSEWGRLKSIMPFGFSFILHLGA